MVDPAGFMIVAGGINRYNRGRRKFWEFDHLIMLQPATDPLYMYEATPAFQWSKCNHAAA